MTNWPVQPFTIRRTCSPLDFGAAVYVNVFEENADPGEPYGCVMPNASVLRNDTHWMTVQGAVFRDVRVRELGAAALGGCFNCAPGTPCALRLERVALPESAAFVCHNEGPGLSQFCGRRLGGRL